MKSRDSPLEVFLAPFAEAGLALQRKGEPLLLLGKTVHDPLLAHGGQFLVLAAVEVIAVPPPVGEVGKPGLGDETDLSGEGFSVGHLTAAGHQAAPLPGVLLRIASPPKEVGGILLHGEAVRLIFEQVAGSRSRRSSRSVPPKSGCGLDRPNPRAPHDPLTALDGHCSPP